MRTSVFAIIAALVMLTMCGTVSADPVSIDGTWAAKVPAPNGQESFDVVFTFRVDALKLSGTASLNGHAYDLVDTRIDGDRIAFAVEGETARYTGTVAGNEIRMQVAFKSSENGTRTWRFVATRAAAPQTRVEQVSIDGEWTGEVPRGGGQFIAAVFELHVDGPALKGRVLALGDEFPVTSGTVAGSHLAFNIGATKGSYTGELAGDTIRMKVKYDGGENGRQTLDFVLTRVKR